MPFDGTNYSELSQKLLECADLLEREGWCQGSSFDGNNYCALGSIYRVAQGNPRLQRLLATSLAKYLNLRQVAHVVLWNDDLKQSKENVVATFRQAAQIAQQDLLANSG
jgi:hypothetical protein